MRLHWFKKRERERERETERETERERERQREREGQMGVQDSCSLRRGQQKVERR